MTTAPVTATGALTGVIPPLLTPLSADGTVDVPSLERLVARHLDGGVDGLFALGSSGEVAFFDDAMRKTVLETVVGIVAGQVPVLAGVIDMQTSRVLAHVHAAEKLGVAGLVATAPFYAVTGPDEIDTHFRTIAAATSVPLWAYDLPICVHTKLSVDQMVQWGSDGVIVGVKDSSGDDVAFRRLAIHVARSGSGISLLTGHEVVVDGSYLAGGHGAVPGLANVDPAGYVRMDRAARVEDWATVRVEQDRLADLFEIVFQPRGKVGPAAGVGSFKTALRELGVFSTNVMSSPMSPIGDEDAARIRSILQDVGLT